MNLSPWFKQSEPPEREGRYQVKDWLGHINYLEWWKGYWRDPKNYDRIPTHRLRCWRGVVQPARLRGCELVGLVGLNYNEVAKKDT